MLFSGGAASAGLGPQDPRPYLSGMTGVNADIYTGSDIALLFQIVSRDIAGLEIPAAFIQGV